MGILTRIGIALDSDLLKRFDRSIARSGYTNRSEAFRDLIRDRLVTEQTANANATVVGTITLIYDHHAHGVTEKLTESSTISTIWLSPPAMLTSTMNPALKCSSSMASRSHRRVRRSAHRAQGRAARSSRDDCCAARSRAFSFSQRELSHAQAQILQSIPRRNPSWQSVARKLRS